MTRHPLDNVPRDPGDAWVEGPGGARYWGRFGAAGLLAFDPARGVLLQHRVGWSHFGGTWALPGGALHAGETPQDGALREAQEEAGVPDGSVAPRAVHVFDAQVWRYTTVIADVVAPFEPVISDPESLELAWTPVDEVDGLPLHPSFAAAWPALRDALAVRPVLLVDAANVVGSVPNGWWKDRAGAADGLRGRLEGLAIAGVAADELGLGLERWYPEILLVTEGKANAVVDREGRVALVRAPAAGDDEIVARAAALAGAGASVVAVTSDRELADRLRAEGAAANGSSWLTRLLADLPQADDSEGWEAASWAATGLGGFLRGLLS
ncbi:NUDIX domain-containing protein [Microbacterium indicum]|uniref:NUDIX domain-containing protein n=1 Tax=Microbacterium indicum TaxID=358100 RepID=UPI000A0274D8|nr:NUDIX hydrolase [Microbacterium indicum]